VSPVVQHLVFYVTVTRNEEMCISTGATLGRQPAEAAGVGYLVAGPVGNAEEIVCVNVVAQADDRERSNCRIR